MSFKIDGYENEFRFSYVSPIELLAISNVIDFERLELSIQLFTFSLEHIEVDICGTWTPVKVKGKEEYYPVGIERNLFAVKQLSQKFIKDVIISAFQKSGE